MAGATVRAVVRWKKDGATRFFFVRRDGGGPWLEYQDPALATAIANIMDRQDSREILKKQELLLFTARKSVSQPQEDQSIHLEYGDPDQGGSFVIGRHGTKVGGCYTDSGEFELDAENAGPAPRKA
jgi:hypothetical protein